MPHPLAPNLKGLSDEELVGKLTELNKKFNIASRTNHHLANQIYFMIEDYQAEYQQRLQKQDAQIEKDVGWFSDKIDIG